MPKNSNFAPSQGLSTRLGTLYKRYGEEKRAGCTGKTSRDGLRVGALGGQSALFISIHQKPFIGVLTQKGHETFFLSGNLECAFDGTVFIGELDVARYVEVFRGCFRCENVGRGAAAHQQVVHEDVAGTVIPFDEELGLAEDAQVESGGQLVGIVAVLAFFHPGAYGFDAAEKARAGFGDMVVVVHALVRIGTAENDVIHFEKGMQSGGGEEVHVFFEQIVEENVGFHDLLHHGVGNILAFHGEGVVDPRKSVLKRLEGVANGRNIKMHHESGTLQGLHPVQRCTHHILSILMPLQSFLLLCDGSIRRFRHPGAERLSIVYPVLQ